MQALAFLPLSHHLIFFRSADLSHGVCLFSTTEDSPTLQLLRSNVQSLDAESFNPAWPWPLLFGCQSPSLPRTGKASHRRHTSLCWAWLTWVSAILANPIPSPYPGRPLSFSAQVKSSRAWHSPRPQSLCHPGGGEGFVPRLSLCLCPVYTETVNLKTPWTATLRLTPQGGNPPQRATW